MLTHLEQHPDGNVGHVVTGDKCRPPVARRPTDGTVLAHHHGHEVGIEIVAQYRPGHPLARMRCSVAQWSRPRVNVESAAAPRNEV